MSNVIVRQAVESDAHAFLPLWNALDTETEFMLFEPGERQMTLEKQSAQLSQAADSEYLRIFVLEDPGLSQLAGFAGGRRSSNVRDRHVLRIVIGIRQSHVGQGWGLSLLEQLEFWAKSIDVTRLELGVITTNTRAISLYRKFGFEIEGTRKNAIRLQAGYQDEHTMGKLILADPVLC